MAPIGSTSQKHSADRINHIETKTASPAKIANDGPLSRTDNFNSIAENAHPSYRAKARAEILLQALYRQINMCAQVQLLSARFTRSSREVLTDKTREKDMLSQKYAVKALGLVMEAKGNMVGRKRRKSVRTASHQGTKRCQRSGTPEILKTAKRRLTHAWECFKRDPEVFSICARSMAFRAALLNEPALVWDSFENLLKENFVSILAFAQTRRLDTKALLPHDGPIPHPIQTGGRSVGTLHPHEVVVNLKCQYLKRPRFESHYQKNIGNYKIHWKCGGVDPTLRRPADGKCDVCSSEKPCDCIYPRYAALFLELIETADGRGTGVRTLTNFPKNTMLGAYMGEILFKDEWEYDTVYSLQLKAKTNYGTVRAIICPKRYGNWARFVNHSCDPSVDFVSRTIGKRIYMMMETRRDIKAFEEITVDYGKQYWRSKQKQCLCRSQSCKDKDKTIPQNVPHPVPAIPRDNPYRNWNLRPESEDIYGMWTEWERRWEKSYFYLMAARRSTGNLIYNVG
ncbi:SET domain-containing protein [Histoplasma capsulatum G186AR]|uniref:SET domain-containing protein n=1 Tax=Ajellomyces capsulatus (strain G186AR / H82 / ATCC MYA-2454 / RMSCC 2432) TaxID=447093 RepID=C0P0P4_AJECG|nr:SET domain-containing protein [Histoplasma capsulatum G186AR]EEH02864.1 SET domain-containing protein [Histoplasma capsulatum G186AR]